MSETPTPRTDAEEWELEHANLDKEMIVSADFARTLERENADLRRQLAAEREELRIVRSQYQREEDLRRTLESQLAAERGRVGEADGIIAAIIKDIRDRRGIGDEWENIDVDVRNEITAEWRKIIRALADPQQSAPAADASRVMVPVDLLRRARNMCLRCVSEEYSEAKNIVAELDAIRAASSKVDAEGQKMDKHTLQVGGKYNWRNQSERLIYMGIKRHNDDYRDWYQFSLVSAPDVVWCEVLDSDLEHFEESAPDPQQSVDMSREPEPELFVTSDDPQQSEQNAEGRQHSTAQVIAGGDSQESSRQGDAAAPSAPKLPNIFIKDNPSAPERDALVKRLRDEVARIRCAAARGENNIPGVHTDLIMQAIAALSPAGVVVPEYIVERAAQLLESAADFGIQHQWADGSATPNADACRQTAAALLTAAAKEPK